MPRSAPVLLLVLLAAMAFTPVPAHAASGPEARATQLIAMDHHAFLLQKATAPPPFDWSTDGCTSTPPDWALTFDGPCQQHDQSYAQTCLMRALDHRDVLPGPA